MTVHLNEADPRVKRTRKLLQQAFMELIGERGFRDITVQDIADRATVNRATFYAHFEDKYALLDSCIREQFREVLAAKLPAASAWSDEHLRVLILTVFDFLGEIHHCKPGSQDLDPLLETAVQQEIARVLLGWLGASTVAAGLKGISAKAAAMLWSWGIFGAAWQWSQGERVRSASEMAEEVREILARSLVGMRQGAA